MARRRRAAEQALGCGCGAHISVHEEQAEGAELPTKGAPARGAAHRRSGARAALYFDYWARSTPLRAHKRRAAVSARHKWWVQA